VPTGQLAAGFGPSTREGEEAARAVLDSDPPLETAYTESCRSEIRDRPRRGAAGEPAFLTGSRSEAAESAADSWPSDRRAPKAYWAVRRGGRREKVAKMQRYRQPQ